MKIRRNYKQEIKDWWVENRKLVKTGVVCGLAGLGYGFIKGMSTSDKLWIDGLGKAVNGGDTSMPCDEFGLTEENCDDPEFLELVRMENETA